LAEDDRINRRIMEKFIVSRGHTVQSAQNGLEVLELLTRHHFDVVLMDITMPLMDGIEATEAIRLETAGRFDPGIPVIALTAHDIYDYPERFAAARFDGFVMKPLNFELLLQTIARLLAAPAPP
jgi:CheY-like chemotaxis protein